MLLLATALAAFPVALIVPGLEVGVLFLSPAIILLASLMTGRYVGEERLHRLAAAFRPHRRRSRRARRRAGTRSLVRARRCRAAGASSQPRWRFDRRRCPWPCADPARRVLATRRRLVQEGRAPTRRPHQEVPDIMRVPMRPAAAAIAATALALLR